ncbi:Membrane-bound lytic murein transglycosylase D precursor [Chitinispirillum alkaliphilum]|nr:Membrane-bound lytic murein transglycosylase D precursor [Chitinispirillum alkaliphilum]
MACFYLEVTSGYDSGKRFKLSDGANTIGRSKDNSICLSKEERVVSSHHAIVYKYQDKVTIQDMSSTNGTYKNGVRIVQEDLSEDEDFGFGEKGPRLKLIISEEELTTAAPAVATKTISKTSHTDNTGYEFDNHQDNDSLFPKKTQSTPLNPNAQFGSYTMDIEQKLIKNQISSEDMHKLLSKGERVEKIMQQGNLSKTQTHFLHMAYNSQSKLRKQFMLIIGSICLISIIVTALFSVRIIQYRRNLNEAQLLKNQLEGYEKEIHEAQRRGAGEREISGLINELEETQSRFHSLTMELREEDFNKFYKDTVELFLHDILARFGETEFHVPPQMLERVKHHIDIYSGPMRRTIGRFFERKELYFPMIHRIFTENNLPPELAYISMLESGFDTLAISHAGAVGLWQFMPRTGRQYGLRVDDAIDERNNPLKSTYAAAEYLKNLISIFGSRSSIMLAIAAYNAGEGRIIGALKRIENPMRDRCFWHIYRLGLLAEETNEYIPRILALIILDENREYYGFSR